MKFVSLVLVFFVARVTCYNMYRGLMIDADQSDRRPEDNETFERVTSRYLSYNRDRQNPPPPPPPLAMPLSPSSDSSPPGSRPRSFPRRRLIFGDSRTRPTIITAVDEEAAARRTVANISSVVVSSPDLLIMPSRPKSFNLTIV